jgi:translation initiation factor IF-1
VTGGAAEIKAIKRDFGCGSEKFANDARASRNCGGRTEQPNLIAGPPRGRGGGRRRRRADYAGPKKGSDGEDKAVQLEGTISAVLAGTMFKVKLPSDHEVLAHISGKMRKRLIRLVVGDKVKLEMSPYDTTKARIVYRIG